MKIRNGFISNSSSSSFIASGYIFDKEEITILQLAEKIKGEKLTEEEKKDPWDLIHESKYTIFQDFEDGVPEGKIGIGKIFFSQADFFECFQLSFETYLKELEKAKSLSFDSKEPIIFGGIRRF